MSMWFLHAQTSWLHEYNLNQSLLVLSFVFRFHLNDQFGGNLTVEIIDIPGALI
jgi:hypothetical protein